MDPRLQRRERIAKAVVERLDVEQPTPPSSVPAGVHLEELLADISGWPAALLGALSRAGSSSGEPRELLTLTDDLLALKSRVAGSRLRPNREFCRAAFDMLIRLESAQRQWMSAFSAATPLAASAAAQQAQDLLDTAVAPLQELVERLARLHLVQGTSAEDLIATLAAAAADAARDRDPSTDGLFAADQAGYDLFKAITGNASPPAGAGVGLHMMSLIVDVAMDRERFVLVASEVYRTFVSREDVLVSVIEDPDWAEAHARASQQSFNLAVASAAVHASASSDTMALEAMMSSLHRLVEGQGRHLLVTLLAVAKGRSYVRLKRRDLGDVLKQVEQAGLGMVLEGFRSSARHAAAHMDFRVTESEVMLNVERGPVDVLSHEQLVDVALAAQESILGLQAGLACALESLALSIQGRDLVAASLPQDAILLSVLLLAGWSDVLIQHDGGETRISGEGILNRSSLSLAAAIDSWLPDATTRLDLLAVADGEPSRVGVDVQALRHWRQVSSSQTAKRTDQAEMALLTVLVRSTINGEPFVSVQAAEGWIASQAHVAKEQDYAIGAPRIRELMRLASHLGLAELEALLRGVISTMRVSALTPVPADSGRTGTFASQVLDHSAADRELPRALH